jgi:hypothetical protein
MLQSRVSTGITKHQIPGNTRPQKPPPDTTERDSSSMATHQCVLLKLRGYLSYSHTHTLTLSHSHTLILSGGWGVGVGRTVVGVPE